MCIPSQLGSQRSNQHILLVKHTKQSDFRHKSEPITSKTRRQSLTNWFPREQWVWNNLFSLKLSIDTQKRVEMSRNNRKTHCYIIVCPRSLQIHVVNGDFDGGNERLKRGNDGEIVDLEDVIVVRLDLRHSTLKMENWLAIEAKWGLKHGKTRQKWIYI